MTSREAAIIACGQEAVEAYGRVKSFYTKFGVEVERAFAEAVGGEQAPRGQGGPDVVTHLGEWEFCASPRSKNASGDKAQVARVGADHVVQVTGKLVGGRISGEEFLRQHGVKDPYRTAGECNVRALIRASGGEVTA